MELGRSRGQSRNRIRTIRTVGKYVCNGQEIVKDGINRDNVDCDRKCLNERGRGFISGPRCETSWDSRFVTTRTRKLWGMKVEDNPVFLSGRLNMSPPIELLPRAWGRAASACPGTSRTGGLLRIYQRAVEGVTTGLSNRLGNRTVCDIVLSVIQKPLRRRPMVDEWLPLEGRVSRTSDTIYQLSAGDAVIEIPAKDMRENEGRFEIRRGAGVKLIKPPRGTAPEGSRATYCIPPVMYDCATGQAIGSCEDFWYHC